MLLSHIMETSASVDSGILLSRSFYFNFGNSFGVQSGGYRYAFYLELYVWLIDRYLQEIYNEFMKKTKAPGQWIPDWVSSNFLKNTMAYYQGVSRQKQNLALHWSTYYEHFWSSVDPETASFWSNSKTKSKTWLPVETSYKNIQGSLLRLCLLLLWYSKHSNVEFSSFYIN